MQQRKLKKLIIELAKYSHTSSVETNPVTSSDVDPQSTSLPQVEELNQKNDPNTIQSTETFIDPETEMKSPRIEGSLTQNTTPSSQLEEQLKKRINQLEEQLLEKESGNYILNARL
jgi:hypothetical protein